MAVRTDYRPLPEMRLPARIARVIAYLLVVVAFTATAAFGGYVVGSRTRPTDAKISAEQTLAVKAAVAHAVAARARTDRAERIAVLKKAMAWQQQRFAETLQRKLDEQHLADGQAAARAFSRGKRAAAAAPASAGKPASTNP